MALNIKSKETEAVVRRLAETTGESLTEAIHRAAEERLAGIMSRQDKAKADWEAEVRRLFAEARRAPVLDPRPADAILGYDQTGTLG